MLSLIEAGGRATSMQKSSDSLSQHTTDDVMPHQAPYIANTGANLSKTIPLSQWNVSTDENDNLTRKLDTSYEMQPGRGSTARVFVGDM